MEGEWIQQRGLYIPNTYRDQLIRNAVGVLSEPFPGVIINNTNTPTSQAANGVMVGLRAGDVVTGVLLRIQTAAAGTLPTLSRFGLADSTGKILALSNDLSAVINWSVGPATFPFTAPYTVLTDGGYFACFLVNGTWGTTQPLLGRLSGAQPNCMLARGAFAPPNFVLPTQTDLPAIGASIAIGSGANVTFYIAVY